MSRLHLPSVRPDDPNAPTNDGWVPGSEDTIDSWDMMGQEEEFAGRIISMPDSLMMDLSTSNVRQQAEKLDELDLWAHDFSNRFTNQSPTHECTCHALIQNMETAWNRQYGTKDRCVFFSPMYSYRLVHGSNWRGGDSMQRTMRGALESGGCPEHAGPEGVSDQQSRFKFTVAGTYGRGNDLNSHGDWMSTIPGECDNWNDHFRIQTVVNFRRAEEMVCALLNGVAIGYGRSGHAIPPMYIEFDSSYDYRRATYVYKDSYDVFRKDSYRTFAGAVGGAYGILEMVKYKGEPGTEPWLAA